MRAGPACRRCENTPVTADGATNVVLLILAVIVALYLIAALIFPERF